MTAATLESSYVQLVRGVLDRLPLTSTLSDIREEIELIEALRKADAEYEAGDFISNEEAKRRSAECLTR